MGLACCDQKERASEVDACSGSTGTGAATLRAADYGAFDYLFLRNAEPIANFLDGGSGFQVFKRGQTGMRVLRNTHAPPSLPGTLSTASHCDR